MKREKQTEGKEREKENINTDELIDKDKSWQIVKTSFRRKRRCVHFVSKQNIEGVDKPVSLNDLFHCQPITVEISSILWNIQFN